MKYSSRSAYIVLLIFTLNMAQGQSNEINAIKNLFKKENYRVLVDLVSPIDGIKSDSVLYYLGMSSYFIGDLGSAKAYLNQLTDDPKGQNRLNIISTLAKIYERESNRPKAIEFYKLLIEIDSNNSAVWRNYGHLCSQSLWNSEAILAFKKSLELNPNEIQSLYGLIDVHIANDSLGSAYKLISSNLEHNYDNPKSLNYGARLSFWLKNYDLTIQYYKSHETLTDLNYRQQKMLGQAYLKMDSFDLAISYLEQSLIDDKNRELTYYNLGMCHLGKEEPEIAMEYLDKAVKEGISPNIRFYLNNLASTASSLGETKKSLDYRKKSFDISSDSESLFQLAKESQSYYADKNIALNYYKRFLRRADGQVDQLNYARFMVEKINGDQHQSNVR